MRHTLRLATALSVLLMAGAPVAAQQQAAGETTPAAIMPVAALPGVTTPAATPTAEKTPPATTPAEKTPPVTASPAAEAAAAAESSWKKGRPIAVQYYRALDKRGINTFETTKDPGVEFTGFKLDFGAAFASQFQNLSHNNTAGPTS